LYQPAHPASRFALRRDKSASRFGATGPLFGLELDDPVKMKDVTGAGQRSADRRLLEEHARAGYCLNAGLG
jgi:hypothetical protein